MPHLLFIPASERAENLLVMARKDFDASRGMVGNPIFSDEILDYMPNSCIEKAFKA